MACLRPGWRLAFVEAAIGAALVACSGDDKPSSGTPPADAASDGAHPPGADGAPGSDGSPPDAGAHDGGPTMSDAPGMDASPTDAPAVDAGDASDAASGDAGTPLSKWPDTTAKIAVLVDQLPDGMSTAQQMFAANHFVGSQKLTLAISTPIRAINPGFLVLHYHLAIWQSAPNVTFILDGMTWGNDYPSVNTHESWFWHNLQSQRIASTADAKILMNLTDPGFAAYWESSLEQQVAAGHYDGVFFDSSSPALLQAEVGGQDARLAGTGAKDTAIAEWGGMTYIQGWQAWIKTLNDQLAAKGIPLIPNTGAFVTTWDNTDYSLTAGIFSEGFASPSFAASDWMASTNELLSLAAQGKILILQNYLSSAGDVSTRLYYLGNYLLVKGNRTYLDYFSAGPLEWYPEWGVDLGAPMTTGMTVNDLGSGGVYRRDFVKGVVLVNPSSSPVTVPLGSTMQLIQPQGGGAVDTNGTMPGSTSMTPVAMVDLAPTSAAILLR